jgi:hypothetical protein
MKKSGRISLYLRVYRSPWECLQIPAYVDGSLRYETDTRQAAADTSGTQQEGVRQKLLKALRYRAAHGSQHF